MRLIAQTISEIGELEPVHNFYTIQFPYNDQFLEYILKIGIGLVTASYMGNNITMTANVSQWHCFVRQLSKDGRMDQLISTMLSTFTTLFSGLSRTQDANGTIRIR
jgi:hypothetical protein